MKSSLIMVNDDPRAFRQRGNIVLMRHNVFHAVSHAQGEGRVLSDRRFLLASGQCRKSKIRR